ncbi:hypothetical protein [Burkholderia anthina]|uniref:hypothetical protein n=1 Tax=Burkholderia anthina TaxID=179879 RepID=UPI00158D97C1|nr:hypothetical protein [Burkholderia anthina]
MSLQSCKKQATSTIGRTALMDGDQTRDPVRHWLRDEIEISILKSENAVARCCDGGCRNGTIVLVESGIAVVRVGANALTQGHHPAAQDDLARVQDPERRDGAMSGNCV